MFIFNHQWLWKTYLRMNNPHYCPHCSCQLKKVKRSEVLAPGSELRQELDRTYSVTQDTIGKVKYHWAEFICRSCQRRYSIDAVRKMEEER